MEKKRGARVDTSKEGGEHAFLPFSDRRTTPGSDGIEDTARLRQRGRKKTWGKESHHEPRAEGDDTDRGERKQRKKEVVS